MVARLFENDFTRIKIFEHYVVSEIKEGVDIDEYHVESLLEHAKTIFGDRPFAYISRRVNSYSINPIIYFKISKIENLVAFAVVSDKLMDRYNVQIEKTFTTKPHELFDNLDEAVNWSMNAVEKFRKVE